MKKKVSGSRLTANSPQPPGAIRKLLAVSCLLWLCACSRQPLPPPGGVVSLVPSVTEIVFALGQESLLTGNTTYGDYPEAARRIYRVGDFSNPSTERIVRLKPRLVFATLPEQQGTVAKLEQLGIKVLISRPTGFDSLFREIQAIGIVLGAQTLADSLVGSLKARLARIPVPTERPSVYLEISEQPLMTVGRSSFINEIIERAGGTNAFGNVAKEYPVVSQEQVIARNPDIIFLLHPMRDRTEFGKRLGWHEINAVRNGQVFDDVNPDIVFRSGPRVVDAVEAIALRLHTQ
jgi:iron complex transport system substrate-binding protein